MGLIGSDGDAASASAAAHGELTHRSAHARRLDLAAIEASLRAVQDRFESINAALEMPRDAMRDEVVHNLMAGYAYIDSLLAADIDALARGNSRLLLELNCLVLWGRRELGPDTERDPFDETERRFYDDRRPGGARSLMNYLADHDGDGVWKRAAGTYIHILSEPQLFIEGNHRTGALIMSQILVRAGQPPFVLTPSNAKAYFDPSSLLKGYRKHSLRGMLEMARLRNRFEELIHDEADARFLLRHADPAPASA